MLRRLFGLLRKKPTPARAARQPPRRPRPGAGIPPPAKPGQAHDYDGPVAVTYAPQHDLDPDPGEVVWTWVPYEEDSSVGKDRPVVVVGRVGSDCAVVMLSSKDHHDEPNWMVLGAGAWDVDGRVSSVRLDRVLVVAPGAVRREGSALDEARFDRLIDRLRAMHHWR